MNLLELATELREVCGISGTETTVASASGEWLVVISAIKRSWDSIQKSRQNWLWMRGTVSFSTVAQQGEYDYDAAPLSLTDFARWDIDTFRIYDGSVTNEQWLFYKDYRFFRDYWLFGATRTAYSKPTEFTVSPTKSLILGAAPDDVYTVTGDYYKTPSTLTNDSDEPDMPERFHRLIVWDAMKFIGMKEGAVEHIGYGQEEGSKLRAMLEIDQLPSLVIERGW